MDSIKTELLFLGLVFLSAAFSTNVAGFGGDGNISFSLVEPDPDLNGTMCVNDFDDNNWDGADVADLGCVAPLKDVSEEVLDKTEGNIWDTDLTNQVGGPFQEDMWFGGNVYRGSSTRTMNKNDRVEYKLNEVILREFRVNKSRPEGGNWSYSFPKNDTKLISDSGVPVFLPADTEFSNGAAIDPPHNQPDNRIECGNGIEDDIVPLEPRGDTPDDDLDRDFYLYPDTHYANKWGNGDGETATSFSSGLGAETPCRADYGRVWEKHDRKLVDSSARGTSEYRSSNGGTLSCVSDEGRIDSSECDGSDGDCSPTHIDCTTTLTTDNKDYDGDGLEDERTFYFTESGDDIKKVSCDRKNGRPDKWVASDSCSTSYESCTTDEDGDESCSCNSGGLDYCGVGRDRVWDSDQEVDCSEYDVVDGGTDSESDINGSSYEDYPNIGDNDPAATWTEFTAHSDNDWGTRDTWSGQTGGEAKGSVWCGYGDATTLDADGPNGGLDGFVVISNRGWASSMDRGRYDPNRHTGNEIIGSYTPESDGGDATDVWLDGSFTDATGAIERKLRAQGKLDCPEDNQICVVRIDKINHDSLEDDWKQRWFFDGNGDDPGDWDRGGDSPSWQNGFKVEASDIFLPSESYSVCKVANRGAGREVVDCDYQKNGEPHSPLPEACGDQPGERMIAQEGNEINHDEIDKYPALKQECVDYGDSLRDKGTKNFYIDYYGQDWGPTLENRYSEPDAPRGTDHNSEKNGISRYELNRTNILGGSDTYTGHYIDFSWDTLRRGKTHNLTTTLRIDDNIEHTVSAVFDWDGDGTFDSDETYNIGSCRTDGCTVARPITVPLSAETGVTAMRVRDSSSDDTRAYGEVHTNVFFINKSKNSTSKLTENACVLDGKVYPEGSLVDVSNKDFRDTESGGNSADKEVCIGGLESTGSASSDQNLPKNWYRFEDDNGGVWMDIDNYEVTQYIRENKPLDSQSYKQNWVSNEDKNASKNPDITGVKPGYVDEKGFALEDDCKLSGDSGETIDCEDIGAGMVGQEVPTWGRFTEGAMNDDFNEGNFWFDVNLNNVHNRVQSGGNTGHPQAEPLSVRNYVVDDDSEWNNGDFSETEAANGYLKTTESSNSGDKNFQLKGTDVYGKYVSETFTTTEELFSRVNVYNEVSPGEVGGHPIVVEYAEDSSFSTNNDSQKFYFNESESQDKFELGAEPQQKHLRFKIGVTDEPLPNQVTFAVDQSGSMSTPIQGVRNNVKWFYEQLGANAEGTIIGAVGTDPYSVYEPADYVTGEGLVSNEQKLVEGAGRLSNGGSAQAPDATISEAANFGDEASDKNCDPPDKNYQCDENYNYRSDSKKAIIWVQYGGTSSSTCDQVGDFSSGALGNHLVDNDFRFYAIVNQLSDTCRSNYEAAASNTGGKVYTLAASPDPDDWRPVLSEIRNDLVGLGEDNLVDRVEVTASTPASYDGSGNTQDDEPKELSDPANSEFLQWYEDSEIDARDDEWAYSPTLEWGIANNGSTWPPSACHGAPREQGVNKKKEEAVYANSYVRADQDVYNRERSNGRSDGNWINPDNTTLSVREGGVTCDLTGEDWGYAVRSSSASDLECVGGDCDAPGDPSSDSVNFEQVDETIPHQAVIPEDDLTFDNLSDPMSYNQDNLKQWPDACGDDRNEFLIREHAAELGGEYNPDFSNRDNYYVCADRPTDCAFDGEVYSEGELTDVSELPKETGVQSDDQEVCLDVVEELPGGEWYDVDNETLRKHLIESGSPDNPEEYVRTGQIEPANPGKPFWHNSSTGDPTRDEALREARDSPYSPLGSTDFYNKEIDFWRGYALEDDCDSDVMEGCDDKGIEETRGTDGDPSSDLIYSHFRESKNTEAIEADDSSTEATWVVRMFVNGSYKHGSNTGQMNENTDGVKFDSSNWGPEPSGWPTSGLNDSAINETEDTWAISSETYDAVGPTGTVYDTGQCYGRGPPQHSEGWVLKNETIMANSYVNRTDVNTDDEPEGVWVDPDKTANSVSEGVLTCDLNSTDWGIGYNNGTNSDLNVYEGDARSYGYNITDRHAVSGPITFDNNSDPLGENQINLKQYPNACGDDQNEFLIREQYSSYHGDEIYPNLTDRDNIYVCADRITDCAYNGAVYSEGQTFDISSETSHNQEMGEQLPDEEICLDLNKSTPGGEWYDKDQEFTLEHRIKGLKDTYNVSNPSFTASTSIEISGVVEGVTGGELSITDDPDIPVNGEGSFSATVAANPGEMQLLKYYDTTGQLQAQIRLRFPSDGSDVERVHLSPELMYNGSEVWSGMEKFSDHDFDRNKYHSTYNSTDWRNQDTRYDRTDLTYFNRTGEYYSPPSQQTNVRGQQKRYYSPEGYATEDDCGPLLSKSSTGPCGDIGDNTQHKSWFSSGNFTGMAP